MSVYRQKSFGVLAFENRAEGSRKAPSSLARVGLVLLLAWCVAAGLAQAQTSVLTAHNSNYRSGQNLLETTLTPANVNPTQFGKLFSMPINGSAYAQPLYVPQVAIPGKGTHNVLYVVTSGDDIYAYDADDNGGIEATPLWSHSLLTIAPPAGGYQNYFGVIGTPVIDPTSNTIYFVSSENSSAGYVYRMHAMDITNGNEKFGGPVLIQASTAGTGSGSSGGVLTFDPAVQYQRPGLMELNGVVYVAFGSVSDNGPWHGWIFSFNATTLQQLDFLCTSANGSGAGIWMGGSGLASEVNDAKKQYGRMFVATGNGSFTVSKPYTPAMSYGMSVLNLDLTGGIMTVQDEFTPYNQQTLDGQDGDLGSGGIILLPNETLASGATLKPLVQEGKSGMIYILNRNSLGGYNTSADQVVQEVQTPSYGKAGWGAGIWGSPAYWHNTIYFGGSNSGVTQPLTAYSFVNGVLSSTPTSQTSEQFAYPGPTPSVSANGTNSGIVWALKNDAYHVGNTILFAYDATNLANLLYSSNANLSRDDPGGAVKFTTPTVVNGKVYVGTTTQVSVYGLLANTPTVAPPVISPAGATFTGSQSVTITEATPNAQIYYPTDGSTPPVNSTLYSGGITVTSNETITAIASATGYLQGPPVSAVFSSTANAANPVFVLAGGSYSGPQSLTITDASAGASIYYTVDGTTPTTSSNLYTQPITVPVSETVNAMATAPGLLPSSVVASSYVINPVYTFNFSQGFAQAEGAVQFNGTTDLDDFRLQLTNGGVQEAGSAFYATPVNIQSFTTDFTFQISNPTGDGITFTIQNAGPTAVGGRGGSLGYAGIGTSVAIKFDIYNNAGEGPDSTGLYTNGAMPTMPAINLVGTGIDLHSGDYMNVHLTYDGVTLYMTITDAVTLATWSTSFPVNIPSIVGGSTAYVGFTGGSGGSGTASQKITYWTYLAGPPALPNFPVGFDGLGLNLSGPGISGTNLQLTDGNANENHSVYFSNPVPIGSFTSTFDFQLTQAVADGFTFVIQNASPTALGLGSGGLGYAGIPNSLAVKFDIYNNAGEGSDSTGLYLNGATPTVPSNNLTSSVNLASGDSFHAEIVYDGTTLTWTLIDTTSGSRPTSVHSATVNIPNVLGSNTAYVGFTAASGDGTAVQNILDWTYTSP